MISDCGLRIGIADCGLSIVIADCEVKAQRNQSAISNQQSAYGSVIKEDRHPGENGDGEIEGGQDRDSPVDS